MTQDFLSILLKVFVTLSNDHVITKCHGPNCNVRVTKETGGVTNAAGVIQTNPALSHFP